MCFVIHVPDHLVFLGVDSFFEWREIRYGEGDMLDQGEDRMIHCNLCIDRASSRF